MNNTITKINNVSAANYQTRDGRRIQNIVIGMTNDKHSGNAYAKGYRQQLSPRITYNYVVDTLGNIYQTIDDTYAPYTIDLSSNTRQIDNQECISICFMPEWYGSSLIDEYDSGFSFPNNPETNQVFLLTKALKKNGTTFVTGLYHYDGVDWILDEAISRDDINRPYESDEWAINEVTEQALLRLTKWLQVRYGVNNTRVLRVYDYFKTYNPAPYIYDEGDQWEAFKSILEETTFEHFIVTPERTSPITSESINAEEEERKVASLIEQYGPDAEVNDITFKNNSSSITDITAMPGNKFHFELGIHNNKDKLWHITNSSLDLSWKTFLENNTDELNFSFNNKDFQVSIEEGYNVGYWENGVGGFNGNVFRVRQSGDRKEIIEATAYGWLRYLKCDGWTKFVNMTASQIFDTACNIANIPHRIITNSNYVCEKRLCFGKNLYEVVKDAIYETMVHEKKWYIIQPYFDKDAGGGIEFRDILDPVNIKQIKFSEDSAITNWSFDSSIDESANIVITYTEGEKDEKTGETGATETGNAKDESTIKKWGRLSKVIQDQTSKEGSALNISAADWLKFYNSPRRRLTLECVGLADDVIGNFIAGNIIYVEIYNVVSVGTIKGCLVVDDCTHKVSGGKHTMTLNCEIVQDGTIQQVIYTAYQGNQEGSKEALEAKNV